MDSPEQIAINLNSSVVLLPVAMKGGAYKLLVLFISSKALKKSCRAVSASLGLLTRLSTYNRKPRPSELDEKLK
jgi:hypothetical protein